jgi:hypothetical protein
LGKAWAVAGIACSRGVATAVVKPKARKTDSPERDNLEVNIHSNILIFSSSDLTLII